MKTREFKFADLSIEVDERLFNYSVYKHKFNQIAFEKSKSLRDNFFSQFSNMDDLAENGFQYGLELIKSVIDVAVEELVRQGMYDINEEYFTDEFVSKYFLWEKDFNQLLEVYYEVCLTEEEAKQYREDRKNNRSRWGVLATSGNFSDAVDAKMTTGMWNVAEGIGHSIFNAIGNAASKATAKAEKKKLFNAVETISALTEGIFKTCFNIHYALIDALNKNSEKQIFSRDDLLVAKSKVERLLENLLKGRIPESDKEKVLKTIISTYPYDIQLYKYLLNEKFEIREVVKLASNFSEDISELLFGDSVIRIVANIDGYNFEKRFKIISMIEKIGKIDSNFDNQMESFNELCLNYNGFQFKCIKELEMAMKEDERKLSIILKVLKKYESNSSVFISNIPEEKLKNATRSYGVPSTDKILVLINSTRLGSANEGIAFGSRGVYSKSKQQQEHQNILYKDFNQISSIKKSMFGVNLVLSDNNKIDLDLAGSNLSKEELIEIMNAVSQVCLGKKILVSDEDENVKEETITPQVESMKIFKKANFFERFVCGLFPLIGLILFFKWRSYKPNKAKDALIMTIIGIVIWIFIFNL